MLDMGADALDSSLSFVEFHERSLGKGLWFEGSWLSVVMVFDRFIFRQRVAE